MEKNLRVVIEFPADADVGEYRKAIGKVLSAIVPALRKAKLETTKTSVRRGPGGRPRATTAASPSSPLAASLGPKAA
jgi:hypothetical protein